MKIYNNVLDTIGNTPLVKINRLANMTKATVVAKIETGNPGNSVKDRMAVQMVDDAEAKGLIKPGGTIIEGTSGNTGMGLALVAIERGYKCIFTTTDKQSKEKVDILRAVGAEVIVCPTNVDASDPRSYYSTSKRLSEETPNSWYVNQYDNLSNRKAHYKSTGPEIWNDTDGKVTHFIVGAGTGGTVSGVGKYLKEKNPDVKIIAVDSYGSVLKKYHETGEFDESEIYPYITEGIGEDIIPENFEFEYIDHFEKVTDKDAAIYTRRLAKEEGMFVGNSAGSAMSAIVQMADQFKEGDVVVVLFHDHGSRYVGKMFNDEWMRERGWLTPINPTALDLIESHKDEKLVTVDADAEVNSAIEKMMQFDISQVPVTSGGEFVGSLDDNKVFKLLMNDNEKRFAKVSELMDAKFPEVAGHETLENISQRIDKSNRAVLVQDEHKHYHIITKHDIIDALK